MLVLHTFGPAFGLLDPSPFVAKAHLLLRLAGLPYETVTGDLRKAPKGKLPILVDDGKMIPDSSFIRFHIEKTRHFDFDTSLSARDRGHAWALEKMLEDHLYWCVVRDRWTVDENFERGPKNFFNGVPALIRPLIVSMIRRKVGRNLAGHGMGRHSFEEMAQLSERAVASLSDILGDRPYIMGDKPCGADATVFGFISSALCPLFKSSTRDAAERRPNLAAYVERVKAQYLADMKL